MQYTLDQCIDQGKREYQEDCFLVCEKSGYLFVSVFDGHGDMTCSHYIRDQMKQAFMSLNLNVDDIFHMTVFYEQICMAWMNEASDLRMRNKQKESESGTTWSGILIERVSGRGLTMNIGDSGILIYHHGNLRYNTKNPTLKNEQVRAEVRARTDYDCIQYEDGEYRIVDKEGHQSINMAGAIGDLFTTGISRALCRNVMIEKIQLSPQSTIVLATDGLLDVMNAKEIGLALKAGKTAKDLVEIANTREKGDNVTVLLINT